MPTEHALVELVDEQGHAIGECSVEEAHTPPGLLHRAFSVLLVDPAGRILLQQRAAAKTRFPLRWANACCGHPAPGEPIIRAGTRRLVEELGAADVELTAIGTYRYRATDPASGLVEHEYDHVLLGHMPAEVTFTPDPREVANLRWVTAPELFADAAAQPHAYAPWLVGVAGWLTEDR